MQKNHWSRKFVPLLRKLDPEVAHLVGVWGLKILPYLQFKGGARLTAPSPVTLSGIQFANRIGLAAGFDKNAEVFWGLSKLGFGFIEVGTVTVKPQVGNPKPRLWRIPPDALVNHMGFNNCGVHQFSKNLRKHRKGLSIPVIANIGKNRTTPNENALEDYEILFGELADLVDGFVVNLSSPNTPGLLELQNGDFLQRLAGITPEKPVWIKLSHDLGSSQIESICTLIEGEKKFHGVVLTNTSREKAETLGYSVGGLSGRPLLEQSLELVSKARQKLKSKTLVGVGGVFSGEDAARMRKAGADLIEVYTGFVYRGPELVQEIIKTICE